ncbi:MAG: hypothetical protein JW987_16525 [Anaerolineaceae bacterium]|nr:hypothetical protein [Anaerolineaceae bacterium]
MDTRRHLSSALLRTGLGFVVWQAVVFVLAWYLHYQLSWGKFFSDILFLIGVFELGIGLMVMIGSPAGVPGGQMATFARSARIGGEGVSEQSLAEILEKRFVVLYLIASGVITFVAAAVVLIK